MDMEALSSRQNGRLWTSLDSAWRSTDQEVGGSSPSGRAVSSVSGMIEAPFLARARAGILRWLIDDPLDGSLNED